VTLQGAAATTIERRYGAATPHFSLLSVGTGGNLTVTNVNFKNGYAVDEGGAIYGEDGRVSVTGGTFTGNHSGEYGGAIWNDEGLTVTGATFTDNSAADYGGAIDSEDDATISGSTFTGNTASTAGGGIYEDGTFAHLFSSRVMFNHAPSGAGGGIYNEDTVTLAYTVVRFNTVNNCSPALSVTGCPAP
jgi:predicted outer membrane repeat protein